VFFTSPAHRSGYSTHVHKVERPVRLTVFNRSASVINIIVVLVGMAETQLGPS
jgi:hypothetical protein